ncbi:putative F-box protein PP2-B8 isoform X2 [Rosa chinensis]|uniref:putative F-box protein PP2-B8 isoform X2 n=1 Tax=Rosa chinensis TaxID=74649 RepID=UPI000D0920E4|nr:putative F-box protein PP2-B8 isoform X2 [Rosa chinensis]
MDLQQLPVDCIANIISLTSPSPEEACRLSLLCRSFKLAVESDAVWDKILPPETQKILSEFVESGLLAAGSKKELYFALCNKPLLIDDSRKSVSLDKWSGKKCYMISARELGIVWGETPQYWTWTPHPESRFPEVAELLYVYLLEIHGKLETHLLSPSTLYKAYLVFKFTRGASGFERLPAKVTIGLEGGEHSDRTVFLDFLHKEGERPGWLEIELGEFFCEEGEYGLLKMHCWAPGAGHRKSGLIVQGIEVRPKRTGIYSEFFDLLFKSAAESDAVWDKFLLPEIHMMLSQSRESGLLGARSKKELCLALCNKPLLIDDGKLSFSLDKRSGKKCYMISARELSIVWGGSPKYWTWTSHPESRFPEVAELLEVSWLEIDGKLETCLLSPSTLYKAYLVFKFTQKAYGFKHLPAKVTIGLEGGEHSTQRLLLHNEGERPGWLEIELGEFFCERGEYGLLKMNCSACESSHWKSGLIVQGIEVRPKGKY